MATMMLSGEIEGERRARLNKVEKKKKCSLKFETHLKAGFYPTFPVCLSDCLSGLSAKQCQQMERKKIKSQNICRFQLLFLFVVDFLWQQQREQQLIIK